MEKNRIIENVYWEKPKCIRIENILSINVKIERGVKKGCVFSQDLLNLYSDDILRELMTKPGSINSRPNRNNIRYANDIALMADSAKRVQDILDRMVAENEKKRLTRNFKKTEIMVFSKKVKKMRWVLSEKCRNTGWKIRYRHSNKHWASERSIPKSK